MELYVEDYMRIAIVLFLHSIIFIQCLAIIELLITSQKIRLLTQLILTFILFICSGAMIPTIYLPLSIQARSEEHTSELQSCGHLVCRLLLEKKKKPCH